MRIVGKKLGVAGVLESNIFRIERCFMHTEISGWTRVACRPCTTPCSFRTSCDWERRDTFIVEVQPRPQRTAISTPADPADGIWPSYGSEKLDRSWDALVDRVATLTGQDDVVTKDTMQMVKSSGNPETAALAILWHYPPKPKNYTSRHFDVSADAKNSCMRAVGRKLGANDLDGNIFMIERCSMRTEVQRVGGRRLPTFYNIALPQDVVNANTEFRNDIVWFSDFSMPVVIQLGKENASDFEALAKTDERILLLALPDVPLYKGTGWHVGIVFDPHKTDLARRITQIADRVSGPLSAELNDKLWNFAGALCGFDVNTRYMAKWAAQKRKQTSTDLRLVPVSTFASVRDLLESPTLNVRGFRKIILSRAYEFSTGSALPDTDLSEEILDLARRLDAEGRGRLDFRRLQVPSPT
ncbi:hypothetical protein LTR27_006186 [Elasticomyces elasticus]|nr:hypothetical protein LTR27_006186 [Elasticomyces elasticus]